jgi:hypothetical protein
MKPTRQARQIRRLEKCIDELIKIHDDGKGNGRTRNILDALRTEITNRESEVEN